MGQFFFKILLVIPPARHYPLENLSEVYAESKTGRAPAVSPVQRTGLGSRGWVMLDKAQLKSIRSLCRKHQLDLEVPISIRSGEDIEKILKVLFSAYLETLDVDFFTLFYRSTYSLFYCYAQEILKRHNLLLPVDDLLAEVYGQLLEMHRGKLLTNGTSLTSLGQSIIRTLVRENLAHTRSKRQQTTVNEDVSKRFPIQMERDRRLDLLRLHIHSAVSRTVEQLDAREARILKELFVEELSIPEIAARLESSVDRIYAVVDLIKKKIQELVVDPDGFSDSREIPS